MTNASTVRARFGSVTVAKLQNLLANQRYDLEWHYEFGQLVSRLVPQSNYGRSEMRRLTARLGRPKNFELILYQHRDFARTFRRSQLPKLRGLTFAHVCVLMGVDDVELRDKFRNECLGPLSRGERVWSVRLLRAKIQERIGKRSHGGRPIEATINVGPQTALRRFVQTSLNWHTHHFAPLEKNLQPLTKQLERNPTEELLELVHESLRTLEMLRKEIDRMQRQMTKIKKLAASARRKA